MMNRYQTHISRKHELTLNLHSSQFMHFMEVKCEELHVNKNNNKDTC